MIIETALLASCMWASACGFTAPSPSDTMLEKLVLQEAEGEPYNGMVAVAGVVLDRVPDRRWSNSVHSVVYQPSQFEGVSRPFRKHSPAAVEKARKAVKAAKKGSRPCGKVLWFHNQTVQPKWTRSLQVSCTIGDHTFYGEVK